ncbi:GNAT family N-acetyltransferase [Roseomonas sp. OT10]|uniref:GNAT family N-acetyltransferase n=1 Tax=Roseomonas cutis TaxID=2897332 RepID=UPI001E34638D|nr:GNAT family N-acetyltransferase [Roseomonas sp. OT10]UFN50910.1 GNAT family N-acetyltransferase [Roseomonas sp. OT10]
MTTLAMPIIHDLRDHPEHAALAADRIWNATWRDGGEPPAAGGTVLDAHLDASPVPLTLIALDEKGRFLGTISIVASGHPDRTALTPWVNALWVEAEQRERGIGGALLRAVTQRARELGIARLYLCTGPHRRNFYERNGWTLVEADLDDSGLCILGWESAEAAGRAAMDA